MSTNVLTPFKVEIYSNNIVIGTVTISKNNPQFYDVTRSLIITKNQSDLFKPVSMGIYLKGEKAFFASLRFSVTNHAEILTSKGIAGLGTDFRTVMAPITVKNNILNFMTSVLATENNTTVSVSDFDPTIVFSDGVSRTQFSFVLNKGESYIIEGIGNQSNYEKRFIGAKVTADKPVSVTNGNFNGQYAGDYLNGSDILMDQSVSEDKLGKEFVLVKGNGANSFLNTINKKTTMEKAIIVAVKDNTEIYLNNDTMPSAILKTGELFETPPDSYKNQGSGHYNLYISSNNNIYVYQLLAGIESGNSTSNANGEATGGFNYIPPLSCYLPKKIDEIGFIDQNRVFINSANSYRDHIPTKFNIITERGAVIDVKSNGVSLALTAANGPFDVTGNNGWVTYSIPNIIGNVAVISTKAVTAGISAGDDAVGYGGYFAGFSSIPLILKTEGECIPEVKLTVTEGFSSYKWLIKDNLGNYNAAPGINNTNDYKPSQAGIYAVKIQQGSCSEIQTADFKFYNCTTYTNLNYETCKELEIPVKFSISDQALNPGPVIIDEEPTRGKVENLGDGKLTYIPKVGESGMDTFRISFCGIGTYPDCETAQININIKKVEIDNIEITGKTITVIAKGAEKPYQYALDNGSYQDSNVFTNVSPGLHRVYVVSSDNCGPAEKEFSVVEIHNLITPNGDGVNDVLDMSLLRYKTDVKFQIFDRSGRKLFEGDPQNNYIWDGRQGGMVLPTASYWYLMNWKDFENSTPVNYTGWILLKNRNSD